MRKGSEGSTQRQMRQVRARRKEGDKTAKRAGEERRQKGREDKRQKRRENEWDEKGKKVKKRGESNTKRGVLRGTANNRSNDLFFFFRALSCGLSCLRKRLPSFAEDTHISMAARALGRGMRLQATTSLGTRREKQGLGLYLPLSTAIELDNMLSLMLFPRKGTLILTCSPPAPPFAASSETVAMCGAAICMSLRVAP